MKQRLRDYQLLVKFRLTLTVVFSAGMAYLIAHPTGAMDAAFWAVLAGGFGVTAAANVLNELMEAQYDAQMPRTAERPLAAGRMERTEALLVAFLTGGGGLLILVAWTSTLTTLLAAASLALYVLAYTPLKRVSPVAVAVGAIPGALPPAIGATAATGTLNETALLLFGLQFVWQFPHFWAIGWLGHAAYRNAGFRLVRAAPPALPEALNILVYTLLLLPFSYLPVFFGVAGQGAGVAILLLAGVFCLGSIGLVAQQNRKAALRVMLASILFLPGVYLALYFGKV